MMAKLPRTLLFFILLGCIGHAFSNGDKPADDSATPTENDESPSDIALVGNFEAGKERYKKTCVNCHGAAGKGVASYPKVSGNEISYTVEKLETYRDGIKIGPNSSLMIMMAKPLTDQEIADLAAYLKDATE